MLDWTFELNNQPMSAFKHGGISFPAFSGRKEHVNRRISICLPNLGPIPPGTYYIFDRQSGGLIGPLRDLLTDRGNWFALYAIDGKIDDETYCNKIKRGNFRLHPKGAQGVSEGCITIENGADYQHLHAILKRSIPAAVPGSQLKAYGSVVVK